MEKHQSEFGWKIKRLKGIVIRKEFNRGDWVFIKPL